MFSGLTSSMRRSLAPRVVMFTSMRHASFLLRSSVTSCCDLGTPLQELRSELVAYPLLREPVVAGRLHRSDVEYAAQHADRADDGLGVVLTDVMVETTVNPLSLVVIMTSFHAAQARRRSRTSPLSHTRRLCFHRRRASYGLALQHVHGLLPRTVRVRHRHDP